MFRDKVKLTNSDIRKYIETKKIFRKFEVRRIGASLGNRNFLINTNNGAFNLRTTKKRPAINKEKLKNEKIILDFFKEKKVKFVSTSKYYDPIENIHIVKYIEGRKICMKDASDRTIEKTLKYLHEINQLAPEFRRYCKKKKIKFRKPVNKKGVLKEISDDIDYLKKFEPYKFVIKWVKDKLKKDWNKFIINEKQVYLNHGDPVSNIIIQKDKIFLIDWEQIKLAYDPGLAYIFLHGDFLNPQRERILDIFSEISNVDREKLKIETYNKMLQLLISDQLYQCIVHRKNVELYKSNAGFNKSLANGRMAYYEYVKTNILK